MAANNFFGYPHGQQAAPAYGSPAAPGAVQPPPGNAAAAYSSAPPAAAVAVAAAGGVQQPTAVPYNQAAAVVAASAASTYHRPVAYSAYQNTAGTYVAPAAGTGAAAAAAAAPPVAASAAAYPPGTYTQYPPQPTAAQTSYYQQQPAGVAVTVSYAVSDPHYQARPVYSTNSNVSVVARPAAIISGPPRPSFTTYSQSNSTTSYSYGGAPAAMSAVATAPKHVYLQNQPSASINLTPIPTVGAQAVATNKPPGPGGRPSWRKDGGAPGAGGAQATQRAFKARMAPKPQQLHYCEVCKISCAGPQTYKEHLDGQKHKKKEQAMKAGIPGPTTRGGNALRCELCDVTCTGSDAYAAHIRGAKHQKVVKLHTKLGKPIPSVDPVLVSKGADGGDEGRAVAAGNPIQSVINQKAQPQHQPKPIGPKITFVQAGKTDVKAGGAAANAQQTAASAAMQEVTIPRLPEEKDVQPVGHDYIEEIKSEDGTKVVSFNCKLCECRFNDPNAKEMHMKGRRHRLQYKKKVNPDLVVDVKPSLRQRKLAEERAKRTQAREEFWRRREEEFKFVEEEEKAFWEERRRFEEEHSEFFEYGGNFRGRFRGGPMMGPRFGPPPPFMFGYHNMMMRRPDSIDDRHVMAKHAEIYPGEEELDEITKIVSSLEKALKLVSDKMTAEDNGDKVKEEVKTEENNGQAATEDTKESNNRILKGVMRVGVLAKGLVLKEDARFRLVVLCGEKPTQTLLNRIATLLPEQLLAVLPESKFNVTKVNDDGGLVVTHPREPKVVSTEGATEGEAAAATPAKTEPVEPLTVDVSLTSPLVREESSGPDPKDVLDSKKCLEALAALRHAKWFQARAQGRQSCVTIIRIFRNFCQRVPTWGALDLFPLELLVEKVLASAGIPLSPGDALRRVFEALAGGILLSDGPGLLDPCEKEPQDAARALTSQQRGDITASAQHALRLIAFRQVHKVLGMEALPPPKFGRGRFARKRRRDDDVSETGEGEQEEKKDKKDGEEKEAGEGGGAAVAAGAAEVSSVKAE